MAGATSRDAAAGKPSGSASQPGAEARCHATGSNGRSARRRLPASVVRAVGPPSGHALVPARAKPLARATPRDGHGRTQSARTGVAANASIAARRERAHRGSAIRAIELGRQLRAVPRNEGNDRARRIAADGGLRETRQRTGARGRRRRIHASALRRVAHRRANGSDHAACAWRWSRANARLRRVGLRLSRPRSRDRQRRRRHRAAQRPRRATLDQPKRDPCQRNRRRPEWLRRRCLRLRVRHQHLTTRRWRRPRHDDGGLARRRRLVLRHRARPSARCAVDDLPHSVRDLAVERDPVCDRDGRGRADQLVQLQGQLHAAARLPHASRRRGRIAGSWIDPRQLVWQRRRIRGRSDQRAASCLQHRSSRVRAKPLPRSCAVERRPRRRDRSRRVSHGAERDRSRVPERPLCMVARGRAAERARLSCCAVGPRAARGLSVAERRTTGAREARCARPDRHDDDKRQPMPHDGVLWHVQRSAVRRWRDRAVEVCEPEHHA